MILSYVLFDLLGEFLVLVHLHRVASCGQHYINTYNTAILLVLPGFDGRAQQGTNLLPLLLQHLSKPPILAQLTPTQLTALLSHLATTGMPPATEVVPELQW